MGVPAAGDTPVAAGAGVVGIGAAGAAGAAEVGFSVEVELPSLAMEASVGDFVFLDFFLAFLSYRRV